VGAFRNWCRTAHVRARDALLFARALRAVFRFERDASSRPENLLDIVDLRTIAKFVRRCGGTGHHLPTSVVDFLERQEFIRNRKALEAIRTALASRSASSVTSCSVLNAEARAADRAGPRKNEMSTVRRRLPEAPLLKESDRRGQSTPVRNG
jgi:hypothetical protein